MWTQLWRRSWPGKLIQRDPFWIWLRWGSLPLLLPPSLRQQSARESQRVAMRQVLLARRSTQLALTYLLLIPRNARAEVLLTWCIADKYLCWEALSATVGIPVH